MITEKEYLEAVKVVQEYNEQIKSQMEKLFNPICFKTPKEIGKYELRDYFSGKVANILWQQFEDCRIFDIKKGDFLSCRSAGEKTWEEFNKVNKIKLI
jgi:hypothetical protein